MRRHLVGQVADGAYAVVAFGVVVAPGLVLARASARGGIEPSLQGFALVAVSSVVAVAYAMLSWRRLQRRAAQTDVSPNVWIAAVHALVVLALLASLLLAVVLHGLGPLQAPLAGQEVTLLALWAAVHLAAAAAPRAPSERSSGG